MTDIRYPCLLFIGDVADQIGAKTACAIAHWWPDRCVGQLRLKGCRADLGVRDLTVREAVAAGANTMIIGTVNVGGNLPEHWHATILEALEVGMDVACGLHARLSEIPAVAAAAQRLGRQLFDVRYQPRTFGCGTGVKRSGKRLLAVGTDCSSGKMYTALSIHKAMVARGIKADFRATGQTGILIAGSGICVDAVVSDFVSGAAEHLTPANDPDHWDVIEGQGSLFHPSASGVTLGLTHGSQPDALVLCHEPTRTRMRGLPNQPLPGLRECLELNLMTARLTNKNVRCVGVSINTSGLTEEASSDYLRRTEQELGVPCVDPIRTGVSRILDYLLG
jgi:uncharacterized NAD-dependent epimerase/dehydratase family protein